jgi:hypothetical protein
MAARTVSSSAVRERIPISRALRSGHQVLGGVDPNDEGSSRWISALVGRLDDKHVVAVSA